MADEQNCMSPHTSEVVDAYQHALLGRFPRARYVVGFHARFTVLSIAALPEWLGDWIVEAMNPDLVIPAGAKKRL
jgi:hypothetical protein